MSYNFPTNFREFSEREDEFASIYKILSGEITPEIRLISAECDRDTGNIIYFYIDRKSPEKMADQAGVMTVETSNPFFGREIISRIDAPLSIEYNGRCIYATKEAMQHCASIRKEHGILSEEISVLLKEHPNADLLKTFHRTTLSGYGELVDFKKHIGYYLNPVLRQKIPTTKAVIYYGKQKTTVFPAAPDFEWLEPFNREREKIKKREMQARSVVFIQAYRALIGRVIPQLLWLKGTDESPYIFRFYVDDHLSEEERETLELVWFEILTSTPVDFPIGFEVIQVQSWKDVPREGYTFFLKRTSPFPSAFEELDEV